MQATRLTSPQIPRRKTPNPNPPSQATPRRDQTPTNTWTGSTIFNDSTCPSQHAKRVHFLRTSSAFAAGTMARSTDSLDIKSKISSQGNGSNRYVSLVPKRPSSTASIGTLKNDSSKFIVRSRSGSLANANAPVSQETKVPKYGVSSGFRMSTPPPPCRAPNTTRISHPSGRLAQAGTQTDDSTALQIGSSEVLSTAAPRPSGDTAPQSRDEEHSQSSDRSDSDCLNSFVDFDIIATQTPSPVTSTACNEHPPILDENDLSPAANDSFHGSMPLDTVKKSSQHAAPDEERSERIEADDTASRPKIHVHNFKCDYCSQTLSLKIDLSKTNNTPFPAHAPDASHQPSLDEPTPAPNTFRDLRILQRKAAEAALEVHHRSGACPLVPLRCDLINSESPSNGFDDVCGVICKGESMMRNHQQHHCGNRLVPCPNRDSGCSALVSVSSLSLHLKKCREDRVTCPHCELHFRSLSDVDSKCNAPLKSSIPRSQFDRHQKSCVFAMIPCPILGCRLCGAFSSPHPANPPLSFQDLVTTPLELLSTSPPFPKDERSQAYQSKPSRPATSDNVLTGAKPSPSNNEDPSFTPAHLPPLTDERKKNIIDTAALVGAVTAVNPTVIFSKSFNGINRLMSNKPRANQSPKEMQLRKVKHHRRMDVPQHLESISEVIEKGVDILVQATLSAVSAVDSHQTDVTLQSLARTFLWCLCGRMNEHGRNPYMCECLRSKEAEASIDSFIGGVVSLFSRGSFPPLADGEQLWCPVDFNLAQSEDTYIANGAHFLWIFSMGVGRKSVSRFLRNAANDFENSQSLAKLQLLLFSSRLDHNQTEEKLGRTELAVEENRHRLQLAALFEEANNELTNKNDFSRADSHTPFNIPSDDEPSHFDTFLRTTISSKSPPADNCSASPAQNPRNRSIEAERGTHPNIDSLLTLKHELLHVRDWVSDLRNGKVDVADSPHPKIKHQLQMRFGQGHTRLNIRDTARHHQRNFQRHFQLLSSFHPSDHNPGAPLASRPCFDSLIYPHCAFERDDSPRTVEHDDTINMFDLWKETTDLWNSLRPSLCSLAWCPKKIEQYDSIAQSDTL